MSNAPTTIDNTRLTCKELAGKLCVSVHFVYQMRACGFRMAWDGAARSKTTTEAEARAWITSTGFRIVRGAGVIKG
jgi:hypothetical protein